MEVHGEKEHNSNHEIEHYPHDKRAEDLVEPTLHWRTWAVVLAAGFMLFADNYGILATGFWLNSVVAGIGGAEISIWFAVAPVVVQVAFMPLVGLFADFGSPTRKWITIGNGVIAAAGCFVAGSAKTMNVGIVGTAFFGFSVINYATCFAIASEVVPHRSRGLGQAVLYCFTAFGGALGALAGGATVRDNVGGAGGWRWNLYLTGIFHVAAAVSLIIFYRPLPVVNTTGLSYWARVRRLDFIGSFLFMAAWVPLLVSMFNGANTQLWKSAQVLAPMMVGIAMFLVFIGHQVFIKKDGVLNHRLFRHRNFAIAMFAIFIEGWFLIPFNTFYGNLIGTLYETRPLHTGLHGFILWAASMVSSAFCGWYSKRFRRVQEIIIIGWFFILAAMIGLSKCTADPSDNKIAYGMVTLAGLGLGVQLTLLVATAQLAVDPDLIGICSALFTGIRSAGATISTAICSAVFTAKIKKNLPAEIAAAAVGAGVPADEVPLVIGAVAGNNPALLQGSSVTAAQAAAAGGGALNAYAKSFPYVWYVILSGICAIIVVSLFLGPVREMMTWQIDNPIERDEDLGIVREAHTHPDTIEKRHQEA